MQHLDKCRARYGQRLWLLRLFHTGLASSIPTIKVFMLHKYQHASVSSHSIVKIIPVSYLDISTHQVNVTKLVKPEVVDCRGHSWKVVVFKSLVAELHSMAESAQNPPVKFSLLSTHLYSINVLL